MNKEDQEINEIIHLAYQLRIKLESSIWYKEFYEKAMTKDGNGTYTSDNKNDDIVFNFDDMRIETYPHYETNSNNLILKYGHTLDEERAARLKRLANEELNKNKND